jgi:hypothetical protein
MVVSMLNSKGQRCHRVGDHYTTRFLKRHPQVATTVARAMDRDRVLALNTASLENFFERLQDCIRHNNIDPEDMWNFDEEGFMMGVVERRMSWYSPGYVSRRLDGCSKEIGIG